MHCLSNISTGSATNRSDLITLLRQFIRGRAFLFGGRINGLLCRNNETGNFVIRNEDFMEIKGDLVNVKNHIQVQLKAFPLVVSA